MKGVNQIDIARKGVLLLDEMWAICDSRMSITKRNRFTSNILLRSRKRGLIYLFSAQVMNSLDSRIRRVIDFTCVPTLNRTETVIKANIFRTGYPKPGSYLNTLYFNTHEIFNMYSTNEEVDMEDSVEDDMEIRFQENFNEEHGHFCTCNNCKGQVFDTWEKADEVAENYWKERFERRPDLKVI
ncbi:MAG: hypothetical protein DRN81_02100 [Thermoproteota archaeon]|nr:MAG: hypothetical protein DRN81_02100 [Candidatus Korarchaeota archaeon]